jgi:hypothetical protein
MILLVVPDDRIGAHRVMLACGSVKEGARR